MIRINLLASTKRAAPKQAASPAGSSQVWAGVYFVGVVAALVICAFVYFAADAELSARRAENQTLDQQIQQLRSRSSRLEEVQAKLAESLALEEVVSELARGRTGPTRAMMEISNILGSGTDD